MYVHDFRRLKAVRKRIHPSKSEAFTAVASHRQRCTGSKTSRVRRSSELLAPAAGWPHWLKHLLAGPDLRETLPTPGTQLSLYLSPTTHRKSPISNGSRPISMMLMGLVHHLYTAGVAPASPSACCVVACVWLLAQVAALSTSGRKHRQKRSIRKKGLLG